jgi:signal transduction histidine kinase
MTGFVVLAGLIVRVILRSRRQRRQAYVDRVKDQQISLLREDMHDVIGSRLVRIASLARRASTRNDPHTLERIHDLSVTTVRSLRNVLSLLSESDLSDGEFFGTLREFVSESCRDVDMPCTLDIDTKNTSHLTRNQRHELLMIITELMSNTLRHSQAKNLYISLTLDDGFELQVRDDGKGFKLSEIFSKGKGSGLHNIMKRCRLAGLDCTIDTELEKGCLYIIKKSSTLA